MNPFYQDESVTIYHGDCLEIMPQLEIKVDAIITDLPYGTTACKWDMIIPFEPMWEQVKRLIKKNGAFATTASQPFTSALVMSNPKMFKYELIWVKSKASDFINANYRPMKNHENVLVFSQSASSPQKTGTMTYNPQGVIFENRVKIRKGTLGISRDRDSQQGEYISKGTNYPKSVVEFSNEGKTSHPTQKPVALFEYLVKTYTNEGDTVLDFTMGSGTTLLACKRTGRKCVGIEKELEYCEIAVKRLKECLL